MGKHYELLIALMRVVNAAVLSKGSQNEQTRDQARKFVTENRLTFLTVFKRSAKLGGSRDLTLDQDLIDELEEAYIFLMQVSGFLEVSISSNMTHLL